MFQLTKRTLRYPKIFKIKKFNIKFKKYNIKNKRSYLKLNSLVFKLFDMYLLKRLRNKYRLPLF